MHGIADAISAGDTREMRGRSHLRLRRHDIPVHILHMFNQLVKFIRCRDDGAAHGHVVPVVEFGGGLDDEIGAELDWLLDHLR